MRNKNKTDWVGKSVFLCLLRLCRSSGWSAAGLYGGPLPNFDCQCRILSEHVLQNHCLEAAMPKQHAYITQGHKGCCSCAFKEIVKYGSAVGGTFALLPVTLSPSLSIPSSCKNGLCLQGPHHLPADIQDMIDEWPRALSRLCQLLIIYTSYLCQKKAVWRMKMKTWVLFMLPVAGRKKTWWLSHQDWYTRDPDFLWLFSVWLCCPPWTGSRCCAKS